MNTYHHQPQFQSTTQLVHQSEGQNGRCATLIVFGTIQTILSFVCFIWCAVLIGINGFVVTYLLGMICGPFHLAQGIVAAVSGTDVNKRRNFCVATIVLGAVGLFVFAAPFFSSDIVNWSSYTSRCISCEFNREESYSYSTYCREVLKICDRNITAIFLPLLIISILIGIIDIILFSVACAKICQCCSGNVTTSGYVVNQSQMTSPPSYPQVQYSYPQNAVYLSTPQTQHVSVQPVNQYPSASAPVHSQATIQQGHSPALGTKNYY